MVPYEARTGDMLEKLMDSDLDAIAHGVNIRGLMGAGIAKAIGDMFPDMRDFYKKACAARVLLPGAVLPYLHKGEHDSWEEEIMLYNLATQLNPGNCAEIALVWESLRSMIHHAEDYNQCVRSGELEDDGTISIIGIPRIGCGIGGLEWETVEHEIAMAASTTDIIIASYSLEGA